MPYPTDSNHASDLDGKIVGIEPSAGLVDDWAPVGEGRALVAWRPPEVHRPYDKDPDNHAALRLHLNPVVNCAAQTPTCAAPDQLVGSGSRREQRGPLAH
ncbi:hypothetical protein K4749_20370 [Streptomyces sp. TRM72054]|uniref:hypothetical protein n=1 Tax=Streptomyces sp. TRM72054 TaxID=2870562 RepID=UPI001C8C6396|nr:hypothetical protein [Streptomyces sp. TRM72054]MBX9395895.1 hypothetical protein [Streptomyces sp. TRM72054]